MSLHCDFHQQKIALFSLFVIQFKLSADPFGGFAQDRSYHSRQLKNQAFVLDSNIAKSNGSFRSSSNVTLLYTSLCFCTWLRFSALQFFNLHLFLGSPVNPKTTLPIVRVRGFQINDQPFYLKLIPIQLNGSIYLSYSSSMHQCLSSAGSINLPYLITKLTKQIQNQPKPKST